MLWTEAGCAIFYIHQTSGTCAGMCVCDCKHQMEKTDKVESGKVVVVVGQNLGQIRSHVVKKVKKWALSIGFFSYFTWGIPFKAKGKDCTGLSMNILHAGNRSSVQRGFFKNGAGNLLLALRFLDRLYNSGNFVIIFSLM